MKHAVASALVIAWAACGSRMAGEEPPARVSAAQFEPAPDVTLPAEHDAGAAPEPAIEYQMRGHFDAVRDIELALIRNRLDLARLHARELERAPSRPGAASWEQAMIAMRQSAARLADAQTIAEAIPRATELAAQCASCHQSTGAVATFAWRPEPDDDGTAAARMQRHQWAAERVWQGLVGPSDQMWQQGMTILATTPLVASELTADPDLLPEVERLSRELSERAHRARLIDRASQRQAAFADILEVCASCHALTD